MEKPSARTTKPIPAPATVFDTAAPVASAKVAVADLEPEAPEPPLSLPVTVLVVRVVGPASVRLAAVVVLLPYQYPDRMGRVAEGG